MSSKREKRANLSPSYCEIPGCYFPFITRHRILPGREGGKYRPTNTISLCPNDHLLADRELYARGFLQDIVDRRNTEWDRIAALENQLTIDLPESKE